MSDLKYRTDAQLQSDASYHRRQMNTSKLRAEAAEVEIERRRLALIPEFKEKLRTGTMKLYPYQQAAVNAILAGTPVILEPGQGRTIVDAAVELAKEEATK